MLTTALPFNELVAESIATHSQVSAEQLIVLDNSAKYCPDGIKASHGTKRGDAAADDADAESLAAIFGTMAALNRMALENDTLCAGERGPSFRGALLGVARDMARLVGDRPVRYVELGPEPWKSRAILRQLLEAGVCLRQYVGVDINPESEATMRESLAPVVGEDRFAYLVADFHQCSIADFPAGPDAEADAGEDHDGDKLITIVTNLGFQEGNDLPSRIGAMLARLTRPGDLLLSEMQVLRTRTSEAEAAAPVKHFYHLPEMRRFSALVGKKFDATCRFDDEGETHQGQQPGYLFNLVPLETEVGPVSVATTLVAVSLPDGARRYVLTNSCLKYTREQFGRAREATGQFVVRAERVTGDESVVFQVAERRAYL